MSFRDLDVDLESQKPFSDSPEFDRATDEASNTLLDLNNHLAILERLVNLLESRPTNSKATEKTCEKCLKQIEISTALFKQLGDQCKQLNDRVESENPGHVFTRDRVNRETKDTLHEFQELQERFAHVNSQLNLESRAAMDDDINGHGERAGADAGEDEQQLQTNEMVVIQDEINNEEFIYQQSLIREREEEIMNIEQGIQELNDIFQDLGSIVQEQGTMVDNIETNIYSVGQSTQGAATELRKALRYQKNAGKTKCYLLIVIVVVLLVVILGIVV